MKTVNITSSPTESPLAGTPPPTTLRRHTPDETRRGIWFMLISLACYTGNTLLLKYLGGNLGIDFSVAMLFRAVIGTVIVFAFFKSRRPLRVKPVFTEPKLVVRGILGVIGTATFYWTIPQLGAGKSTLLGTTYVLFGAIFAAIFLREHLSRRKSVWLVIAFAGVALLSSTGTAGLGLGFAEFVALFGAVTAAGVIVLIRDLTLTHSNATIYFCQCAWIGVAVVPLAIMRFEWPGWSGIALLSASAVAAGYGQLAMSQGYRLLKVATGASIQMALPVTASIGGLLLFGETFTALQVAGAALTVFGTWRVTAGR